VAHTSDRPQVSVVIVNYNTGAYLARCLTSLAEGCEGFDWDAVVVDNGSADGSEHAADGQTQGVRLIREGANLGFARAANIGARQTSAAYILLLNPDCRLTPGSLAPLVTELERRPECQVAAPLVVDEDGTAQGNARGDPTMMTGLFGRTSLMRRLFPRLPGVTRHVVPADDVHADGSQEVDWVSGACCLIRRRAFDRVGGFDERYFLYWEDADLCRRIRQAGGTVRFRPARSAPVVHTVGRSSASVAALAVRAFHESAYRYYATHVAPSPFSPARWTAWALLKARAWVLTASRQVPTR
jgi:N-acetylglucosaminyl-diphospho-decaprenol L-rhamnosyltransferase